MSIEQANNRDMASATNKANKGEEYFFSGGLEFQPYTVIAESQDEAYTQWLKVRQPVTIKGDNK